MLLVDDARIIGVDFMHEVSNVFVGDRGALKVLLQHCLYLCEGHAVAVLLIKDLESLCGFRLLALLVDPAVGDCLLHEFDVYVGALQKLRVDLHEVCVDGALG